ncbi:MAG TPA: tRNA uridine-5-carboxymethylaminomethyl(34) synthesis GTPase MnmE [Dongiaceae bacterium]|nr:tRNA uridine-5-carboxymethylaminomethyl(34) synthesis GTPase MnmE [Dongiaceae bacterium]
MSETPPRNDTIVAIGTPPGRGGVGMVRLSGPRAAAIADALFHAAAPAAGRAATVAAPPDTPPRDAGLHGRARYGTFVDVDGVAIDAGYRIGFRAAASFTGEPTEELWAHGSPMALRALVEAAVARGARAASPGEFSLRAFLSGRIDLTQAEAIRDLVEARTRHQARAAHEQATGRLSAAAGAIKERLIDVIARVEAAIEFAEEPEAERFLPDGGILPAIAALRDDAQRLVGTYESGRRLRDGAIAVLVGAPNVGKSSLFNRLLEEERAIVTPIAGTTRDLIEESLDLGGVPVRLVDTAGLHEAGNDADAEAVRRARAAAAGADLLIAVVDWTRPLAAAEEKALAGLDPARTLLAVNKTDAQRGLPLEAVLALRKRFPAFELSARTGQGVADLRRALVDRLASATALSPDEAFLSTLRQRDLLADAATHLGRALGAGRDGLGGEYLVVDLRDALDRLGALTGEVGVEEIYARLFASFCIGK